MKGYLKNWRGEELLDQFDRRIPIEHFHNCDEYGKIPWGEKSRIFSPTEEPRIIGEEIRVLPGRIVGSSPSPATYSPPLTRRRIASNPGRIGGGNPGGFWNDIKAWWTGLKPGYRYGIFGGLGLIGIIIAATQRGEGKSSSVKKI
ncbi:hypothetical protein ES702_01694 [subsurface metagenome]